MDIPSLSIAMATASTQASASMSMMKKSMDMVEQQGEQIAEMISDCTIDIKI